MGRQATVVLYVLALVSVVVGVDVLFFRNRFWERLMVNIGIVLVLSEVLEASMNAAATMAIRSKTAVAHMAVRRLQAHHGTRPVVPEPRTWCCCI
jgi:hypothetical protein